MTEEEAKAQLDRLMPGTAPTMAVYAAAELGIPDLIAAGKTRLEDLAAATGTRPDTLFRLLRFLIGEKLFTERDGAYALTPAGALLQSGAPGARRSMARLVGIWTPAWLQIIHSLKTGGSAFTQAYGQPVFDHFDANPEQSAIFDEVMEGFHGTETASILAAYDFSRFQRLMDVGGGNGSMLIDVLHANADLQGIVFDRPQLKAVAEARIAAEGLDARCEVVGGDFFASVPSADGMILRHIIHDWNDAESVAILSTCRRALAPGGRLILAETVVAEDDAPSPAKSFDISMMVLTGGKERTETEYAALFAEAGLALTQVIPTTSRISLVEAQPA